jgi:hypothetical protein
MNCVCVCVCEYIYIYIYDHKRKKIDENLWLLTPTLFEFKTFEVWNLLEENLIV